MSKTWFLPPRSSQATEGDGHRNKQSRNSVVCVQVFAQSATGEQRRGKNTSCPEKPGPSEPTDTHAGAACGNTEMQGEQYEQSTVMGEDAGLENGEWTRVAAG